MEAFIYFFLGILASLIINLATPSIQKWLERKNLVNIHQRITALEDELALVTELHANSSKMLAVIARDVVLIASLLALGGLISGTAIMLQASAYQIPTFRFVEFFGTVITSFQGKQELMMNLQNASWVLLAIAGLLLFVLISTVFRVVNLTSKVRQFERYKQENEKRRVQLMSRSISQ